jgi:hypothetical protein
VTESELLQEITAELTIELQNQPTFNADVLALKVKDAYRKVKSRRCYQNTSKTDAQIIEDLYDNYFYSIEDIAKYNFAKLGGDFEVSHSENGTSRTWVSEDDVLGNINAFVKVL